MIAERLTAQLLAGRAARDPGAVAKRLLAIQAQDLRGARLAVRARTRGLSAADVDRALTEERSLVIAWLNRGTLHLVRSEDYGLLQALTTPPLARGNARRLAQEGVSPDAAERGVAAIERSLADEGPLGGDQLRERLRAAGVPSHRQALYHLLFLASLRGLVVRGPLLGGQHAYVLVRDWLGEPAPVEPDRARAELARRYLAGHGPADERDLAKWTGLPLRDARAALAAIAPELVERSDGLVDLASRSPAVDLPPPRLLGAYEPLLLGWRSRQWVVAADEAALITANGLFRPFALIRGRAAAIWSLRRGCVVLEPFTPLAAEDAAVLDADARDVARYLAAGSSNEHGRRRFHDGQGDRDSR